MPRPTKKFSPSLLTKERKVIRYFQIIINATIISPKQHLSPFSFIFSLQNFSSTLFHLQTNIPLKAMINNPFKEIFMGKDEKVINILTIFSIFHKSGIKIFLNRLLTIKRILLMQGQFLLQRPRARPCWKAFLPMWDNKIV